MASNHTPRRVKTVKRSLRILEALEETDGETVTTLADRLGFSASTIYNHLVTLEEEEYVTKADDGSYHVGLKSLKLGTHAKRRSRVASIATSALFRLAEETGEIAWLTVEEHGKAVYLEKVLGDRAVQPYGRVGDRVALYNIAAGKAMLAHLPPERVREVINETEMRQDTENTITDMEALESELETVRERGYALNDGEVIEGFRAVAAPVVSEGALQGAIAVSGPASRLQGERFREDIPDLLTRLANELEIQLQSRA